MTNEELIQYLHKSAEEFKELIGLGFGMDEEKYEHLCTALRQCAERLADSDYVLKAIASILMDL